jgi:hypothetical protein
MSLPLAPGSGSHSLLSGACIVMYCNVMLLHLLLVGLPACASLDEEASGAARHQRTVLMHHLQHSG